MKTFILTCLLAIATLTSCSEDKYYYQTPGEITGQLLTEMIDTGHKAKCRILPNINEEYDFKVEGQFIYLTSARNTWAYDLNHLVMWEYSNVGDYFIFEFNK